MSKALKASKDEQKVSKDDVIKKVSDKTEITEKYIDVEHKTTKYMSIYEYSSLISARSLQLLKQPPILDTQNLSMMDVAEKEIRARVTKLVVRRTLPNGDVDNWLASEMEFPDL